MKLIIFTHCCRLQCRFDGKNDAWHHTSEASNNQVNNFIHLFFFVKQRANRGKCAKQVQYTYETIICNMCFLHCMAVAVQLLLSLASLKHEQTALTNSLAQIPKLFFFFYICAFYSHSYTSTFSLSPSLSVFLFALSLLMFVLSAIKCSCMHLANTHTQKTPYRENAVSRIHIHRRLKYICDLMTSIYANVYINIDEVYGRKAHSLGCIASFISWAIAFVFTCIHAIKAKRFYSMTIFWNFIARNRFK